METLLRAALLDWLRADPVLTQEVNRIAEEAPIAASPPWLGLVASASTDWSTKTRLGREVRIALELHTLSDDPASAATLNRAIEERIERMPREQTGFEIASVTFLRSRAEQRPRNRRATLLEYRFRLLSSEQPHQGTTR